MTWQRHGYCERKWCSLWQKPSWRNRGPSPSCRWLHTKPKGACCAEPEEERSESVSPIWHFTEQEIKGEHKDSLPVCCTSWCLLPDLCGRGKTWQWEPLPWWWAECSSHLKSRMNEVILVNPISHTLIKMFYLLERGGVRFCRSSWCTSLIHSTQKNQLALLITKEHQFLALTLH